MVLADASVWVRGLRLAEPYASGLDQLMRFEQVARHDLVFGELLMGDRGGRREFLTTYAKCIPARTVPHFEVIEFVRARKLYGRGVGWIDVHLLASALSEDFQLWTTDQRLDALAKELGAAYRPLAIKAQ